MSEAANLWVLLFFATEIATIHKIGGKCYGIRNCIETR
jgi:hypothetical protein